MLCLYLYTKDVKVFIWTLFTAKFIFKQKMFVWNCFAAKLVELLLIRLLFFFSLDNHVHQQCKKTVREWALWPFIEERTQMKVKSLLCFLMNVFINIIHSASMQVFLHSHRFRKKLLLISLRITASCAGTVNWYPCNMEYLPY